MKRIGLCLTMILVACTGSFEQGVPTLLIIGYGGEDGQLALVQEVRTPGSGAVTFEVLSTVDDIPGEVLAHDVVDRNNERSELVVLSQNGDGELFASIFNLNAIVFDPEGEGTALELKRPTINLSETVGVEPFVIGDDADDEAILEVSENGRYLAVLSEAQDNTRSRLDVIDIEADRNNSVELLNELERVENSVLFLDQDAQRLYYLQEESAGQVLFYLDLNDRTPDNDAFEIVETDLAIPDSRSTNRRVRDLIKLGQTLITLQPRQYTLIDPGTPFTASTPVETIDNSQAFVTLNSAQQAPLILYSDDELAIYRSLSDEADVAENVNPEIVAASVQLEDGFIYFLENSSNPLAVFDLRRYLRDADDDLEAFDLISFQIRNADETTAELPEPVFIERTRAVIETQ